MIAKIEMKLSCTERLSYQMSSLFQGALMELLPASYAEKLHISGLHPYTQHLEFKNNEWYWVVSCLDEEAVTIIIHEQLMNLKEIQLTKKELQVLIMEKNYEELSHEQLMKQFYEGKSSRYMKLCFLTPTAFKSQGKYLFYPELRCIYQSLMNKYDASLENEKMMDEETLEQLCDHSEIIQYDLRSLFFHMEGVKIPSFIGKITIKFHGTQTMANFADMLFTFGTYSGVGIKASVGMGALRYEKEGGVRGDRTTD